MFLQRGMSLSLLARLRDENVILGFRCCRTLVRKLSVTYCKMKIQSTKSTDRTRHHVQNQHTPLLQWLLSSLSSCCHTVVALSLSGDIKPSHCRPIVVLCWSDDSDEQRMSCCLSFGCQGTIDDVTPRLCMIRGVGREVVCQLTWVGGAGDALVPHCRSSGGDCGHSLPSVGVGISYPIVVH